MDDDIDVSWDEIDDSHQSPMKQNKSPMISKTSREAGFELFIGGLPLENPLTSIHKIIDQSLIIGTTRMKHGKNFAYAFIRVKDGCQKQFINQSHTITINNNTLTITIKPANKKTHKVFFSGLNKSSSGSVIMNIVNALGVDNNGLVLYRRNGKCTGKGYIKVNSKKGMETLLNAPISSTSTIKFQRFVSPKWSHKTLLATLKTQVTKMNSIVCGLKKKINSLEMQKKKKKKKKKKAAETEKINSSTLNTSTPKPLLGKMKKNKSKKRQRSPITEKVSPLHKRMQISATSVKQANHPIIVATPFQQSSKPSQTSEMSIKTIDTFIEYLQHLKCNSIESWKPNHFVQLNID